MPLIDMEALATEQPGSPTEPSEQDAKEDPPEQESLLAELHREVDKVRDMASSSARRPRTFLRAPPLKGSVAPLGFLGICVF